VSGEDPTRPLGDDEDPTESLGPDASDAETEALGPGASDAETAALGQGASDAETEALRGDAASEAPTEQREPGQWAPHQPEVQSGTGILVAAIVASVALVVVYILAGGLDYKPTPVADPCDARAWTDPTGLEDTAQQLAFSALDGAACDLGVSREELTRALATPESQQTFLDENGISDAEFEEALRSGIERAVDDAENAGAIDPVVASGIRTAVSFLPLEQLIPLIQDASSLLEGGQSGLGDLFGGDSGLGGLLDGLGELFGGAGSGSGDPGSGDSGSGDQGSGGSDAQGQDLGQSLRDQLPPEIEQNLPPGIEDELGRQIQQGLQNLFAP
jgi:hypothetical protein